MIPVGQWGRKVSAHLGALTHRDVQPDQLGHPRDQDLEHTSLTHAIQHHLSGHLGLNGQSAVDAEPRITASHVACEFIWTPRHRQHDSVDLTVGKGCSELAHCANPL